MQEEVEAEEEEEEEEAKNIQKRLAANLSEEDYDLNFFQVFFKLEFAFEHLQLIPTVMIISKKKCFWFCTNEAICCRGEG